MKHNPIFQVMIFLCQRFALRIKSQPLFHPTQQFSPILTHKLGTNQPVKKVEWSVFWIIFTFSTPPAPEPSAFFRFFLFLYAHPSSCLNGRWLYLQGFFLPCIEWRKDAAIVPFVQSLVCGLLFNSDFFYVSHHDILVVQVFLYSSKSKFNSLISLSRNLIRSRFLFHCKVQRAIFHLGKIGLIELENKIYHGMVLDRRSPKLSLGWSFLWWVQFIEISHSSIAMTSLWICTQKHHSFCWRNLLIPSCG